jgi:hypothetical protein
MLNKKKIQKQYAISTGHMELEDTMEFNIVPPLEKKVKKSQVWHAVFSVFMPKSNCCTCRKRIFCNRMDDLLDRRVVGFTHENANSVGVLKM